MTSQNKKALAAYEAFAKLYNEFDGLSSRNGVIGEALGELMNHEETIIAALQPAPIDIEKLGIELAEVIAGVRWDKVERPAGNTQCRSEYAHYLKGKWIEEGTAIARHIASRGLITQKVAEIDYFQGWIFDENGSGIVEITDPKGRKVGMGFMSQGSELASDMLRDLAIAHLRKQYAYHELTQQGDE